MSWLARSLANSLRLEDGNDDGDDRYNENDIVSDPPTTSPRNYQIQQQHQPQDNELASEIQQQDEHEHEHENENDDETEERGVKEDLDEIKQTLTRQFWGMASFLAPPPTTTSQSDPSTLLSNQSDHSLPDNQKQEEEQQQQQPQQQQQLDDSLNSNQSSDMEQVALVADDPDPNLSTFGSDSEGNLEPESDLQSAVGITEEVLTFATNIAMHPETWLDFPIDEEDDTDDFDMSDAQQDHAAVIERIAPRLAALRIELCPCHMSEGYFWKVYFVLLHSRLHKQDAGILSTPQVMAARAMWMQELQKQTKPEFEFFGRNTSYSRDNARHDDFSPRFSSRLLDGDGAYSDDIHNRTNGYRTSLSVMEDNESEKDAVESSGTHFFHKEVNVETPIIKAENKDLRSGRPSQIIIQDYDDDGDDDWPEDDSDLGGYSGATLHLVNEEDISFSDLEDDDYGIKHVSTNTSSKVEKL